MALVAKMIRQSCLTAGVLSRRVPVTNLGQVPVRPLFTARGANTPSRFQAWRGRLRNCSEKAEGGGGAKKKEGFLAWYNRMLEERPYPTKMVTSGVLFGGGDVLAQLASLYSSKDGSFDLPRFIRAFTFGFVFLGPLAHLHFNFLEYLVVKRLAVSTALMPFAKMFIEQFTYWAPGINAFYHFIIGYMEGIGMSASIDRVKERWVDTMKANYILWPAVQIINFKFVPISQQLNFVLVVSLFWAVFLSQLGAKASARKED